jgi:hypothetical protein
MNNMSKLGNLFNLLMIGFVLAGAVACGREDEDLLPPVIEEGAIITVNREITTNTTWKAGNQYLITGFVYVRSGATLTIEPGTIIKGDKVTKGALFIDRGAKIMAVGTAEKPIVFTSNQPAGQRKAGDWGGLVILGKAPVNKTPAKVEGEDITEFGGTDPADNSGELKYVRVEFAGIAYNPNQEINSLTFGGVGSGTKIEYVQASFGGDDSFEWFGGTVHAKHLIAYRGLDDDFDTDNGFSGLVQYGYILRDPAVADQAGDSNGFESDNDGTGTTATPQTSAKFANITVTLTPKADNTVDGKFASAMRIRRNSAISVYNSVFTGAWPRSGLRVENDLTIGNFTSGLMKMDGVVLATTAPAQIEGITEAQFKAAGAKNTVALLADLKFDASFNKLGIKPNGIPAAGSPLLTGGATLPAGFEPTAYAGAFGTTDWTAGWANWDPQNTDYELKK